MSSKLQSETPSRLFETMRTSNLVVAIRDSLSSHMGSHVLDRAVKAGGYGAHVLPSGCEGRGHWAPNLLRKGPVVISLLWGNWYASCNFAWTELAVADAEIMAQGATLIGISPHLRRHIALQ